MKNKRIIFSLLAAAMTFVSCEDYLDADIDLGVDEAEVFGTYAGINGYLDNAYEYVFCHAICQQGATSAGVGYTHVGTISDELSTNYDNGVSNVNKGAWYGSTLPETFMGNNTTQIAGRSLRGLRIANKVIDNIKRPADMTEEQYNQVKGQAHFFRGFFYFELIKRFGGLPNWMKTFDPSAGESNFVLPRLSYGESTDLCVAEFDEAAKLLPAQWDEANTSRASRIAALSFKALAELYAASPLMQNGFGMTNQVNDYNKERLANALQYTVDALNAIDKEAPSRQIFGSLEAMVTEGATNLAGATNGALDLNDMSEATQKILGAGTPGFGYANLGYSSKYECCEDIFTTNIAQSVGNFNTSLRCYWINQRLCKATGNWGYQYMAPTQQVTDWYETKAGYKVILDGTYWVTDDPKYSANANPRASSAQYPYFIPDNQYPAMYEDRDPRYTYTIQYPGERWGDYNFNNNPAPYYLATWIGGDEIEDAAQKDNETGYALKKFVWDKARNCPGASDYNSWFLTSPHMRTTYLWLMYAEALNELSGPTTVGSVNYKDLSAVDAINALHDRCNHVHVLAKNYADAKIFRDYIRQEWSIETLAEHQRWFNIRRWMIAEDVFSGTYPIDGVIVKPASDKTGLTTYEKDPATGLTFTFERKECIKEVRVFDRKHYWYPLPQDEIERQYITPQNPGW